MPLGNHTFTLTLNGALAALLWVAGCVLTLGDWLGVVREDAGFFGVACVAGGHMLTTCGMFARQEKRERAAFHLGQEAARMRPVR